MDEKEYNRLWRKRNPERVKQYNKKNREKPGYSEYVKAYKKIWNKNNKHKHIKYYKKNKAKIIQRVTGWRWKNMDKVKKYSSKSVTKNRDRINTRARNRCRRIRIETLRHYGGKCTCCGENHMEFLSIDHMRGNGQKHRRENGISSIYDWLRKSNYPTKDFQILCHNCNLAKGFYGYCPHKKEKNKGG